MAKAIKITSNPDFDDTLIVPLLTEVPTKQDKFKRLFWRIYLRKVEDKHKTFEEGLRKMLLEKERSHWPYKGSIEIFVGVTAKQSRLKQVDVDNLLKSVLDALKGVAYKDDSQITRALVTKDPMPIDPRDSLGIGIRNLDRKDSLFNVKLFTWSFVEE